MNYFYYLKMIKSIKQNETKRLNSKEFREICQQHSLVSVNQNIIVYLCLTMLFH